MDSVVAKSPLILLLINGVIAPYFLAAFAISELSVVTRTVPINLELTAYSIGYFNKVLFDTFVNFFLIPLEFPLAGITQIISSF